MKNKNKKNTYYCSSIFIHVEPWRTTPIRVNSWQDWFYYGM